MSLATRCTHCGTIFKIVQDQLKVSEGWVRCGRCHDVFNAMPSLFDLDSEPPPPRPTPSVPHVQQAITPTGANDWSSTQPPDLAPPTPISEHTPLTAADLASHSAPLPAATEFELDTSVELPRPEHHADGGQSDQDVPNTDESDALDSRFLLPSRDGQRQIRRRPGPEFADAQFPSDAMLDAEQEWAASVPAEAHSELNSDVGAELAASPLPSAILLRSPSPPHKPHLPATAEDDTDPDEPLAPPSAQPSSRGHDFVPEQAKVQPPPSRRQGQSGTRGRDPSTQTPEFVKRAQRLAFWRHPATRGVLLTLLLGLVLSLGTQLMHQFRDLVAAYFPETRPLLSAWCEQIGCHIRPPLHLEVLQVDSATLLRTASEGPDRYRLTVSIHNRADIDVAWPHIDLSLTDERGSIVARRAFQASDARMLRSDPLNQSPSLVPLPSAVPRQQSTTLQWSLKLDNLQPAGYTAELFYP
jgi:predicted Zn finger-like uncharacterized protein